MDYLRPGMFISITQITGNFPTLALGGGTITADSISIQGGGCTISSVFRTPTTLDFTVTADEDAQPGVRDIRIAYIDSNASPVIVKDKLTILNVGCLGSQLWFHTIFDTAAPTGLPPQDVINLDKLWMPFTASQYGPPRLWLWDFSDENDTLGTAEYPMWNATDNTTSPDRHETVPKGRESGEIGGYLTGDISETNLNVHQWNNAQGAHAYAVAPDEFIGHTGPVLNEQRWTGFPVPLVPSRSMTNQPKETFYRKPHAYMATGDYFWSNNRLSVVAGENETWCGHGGPAAGQSRFTALPMWYRGYTTGPDQTFDPNYTYPFWRMRRVEQGEDAGTQFCGYNDATGVTPDPGPNALMKGVMMISIEPLECVMPGPQTNFPDVGSSEAQNYTFKRRKYADKRRGIQTHKAKIKILYQDLWAFKDYYNGGGGAVTPGPHKMAEPIVLAEAYCPRMDFKFDYEEWSTRGQLVPSGAGPVGDYDCFYPKVTMRSQKFQWTKVLSDTTQVNIGDSEHPTGGPPATGNYLNSRKAELVKIADYFIKEFDNYACQLVVHQSQWCPNPPDAAAPKPDQQVFGKVVDSQVNPAMPGRTYATDISDREGTFLAVNGYIEVVEK